MMRVYLAGNYNENRNWVDYVTQQFQDNHTIEIFDPIKAEYSETSLVDGVNDNNCELVLYVESGNTPTAFDTAKLMEYAILYGHRLIYCNLQMSNVPGDPVSELRLQNFLENGLGKVLSKYAGWICGDIDVAISNIHNYFIELFYRMKDVKYHD